MKIRLIHADSLYKIGRLDSRYYLSPGVAAKEVMAAIRSRGVAFCDLGGLGKVWAPHRFKRAYAPPGEPGIPYLRPYDVFDYLPVPADYLSRVRTRRLDTYRLRRGTILQTCSGRNLGPALVVDAYLVRFLLSHDMVRIEIEDEEMRWFVLGFLQSEIGQQIIKQDKTGSVIDHISDSHVASLEVPLLDKEVREAVAEEMRSAVAEREQARVALADLLGQYVAKLPKIERQSPLSDGWTVRARQSVDRLDAAFHDPLVETVRASMREIGGVEVRQVADVAKPAGRYRTRYVDGDYGRPILSGGQLLQAHPVNLRYMSAKAFDDASRYELRQGWIIYAADGRAEEGLGLPALVTSNRDGWLASGHVGRIIPKEGVSSGWLWLACRSPHVQLQIRAAASGSVVDSTFPWDMLSVVVPPPLDVDSSGVERAWERFVKAEKHEAGAKAVLAAEIERVAAEPLPDAVRVKPTAVPAAP